MRCIMNIYNTPQLLYEIKAVMLRKNVTFTELGRRINKSPASISQIFKLGNPRADNLIEICNALDITISIDTDIEKDGE